MRFNQIVKIGEILEIKLGDLCVRTKLQEVLDDDKFVVFQPTVKGIPLWTEHDEVLDFAFYRANGVFTFSAKMDEAFKEKEIKLCRFKEVSEVKKIQRRQSYRMPIVLDVLMENMDDEDGEEKTEHNKLQYKGKTINFSEKSIQLKSYSGLPEKTKLMLAVKLTDTDVMNLQAEVLRCEKPEKKTEPFEIVLLFYNCSKKDRAYISKYILQQQIIARKKKQ